MVGNPRNDQLESSPGDVTLNTTLSALSHPTRRYVLTEMRDQESQPPVGVKTDTLLEDSPPKGISATGLHHSHIPKLENAGFIDWNREMETISRGPDYGEIEPLLELLDSNQDKLPGDWPL